MAANLAEQCSDLSILRYLLEQSSFTEEEIQKKVKMKIVFGNIKSLPESIKEQFIEYFEDGLKFFTSSGPVDILTNEHYKNMSGDISKKLMQLMNALTPS